MCVYYPLATLPGWLQPLALALQPTYVFEGLRGIVLNGTFNGRFMVIALGLNLVFIAAGYAVFLYYLNEARRSGSLVQMGE